MSAIDKEKIFDELRNYHTHRFPVKIKNLELDNLRAEFVEMEDRIVGMILSLVNGKAEFMDATKELEAFQKKLETIGQTGHMDETSRNLFAAKIGKLEDLMVFAKKSDFKLKRIRPNKNANRIPTNKVTVT
jgi:hypothetical protein